MAVYREKTVPIPRTKGITINRGDANKVLFVKEAPYDPKVGYSRPRRTTIGYVCNDDVKLMHPTSGYKAVFPSLWEKYFNETVPPVHKRIGLYAAATAINAKTGIKDIMDKCFGKDAANAIMDFVLYSMLYQTSIAEHFESRMDDQQLFSGRCPGDSCLSQLFNEKISFDQILRFKKGWARRCKEDGVGGVWLCIDGSNDDCECEGVTLAEKGHAKSLRNRKIVSFTYAVTADGRPVTFDVYRGGLVDAKAMRRILSFLSEAGIPVRGVILDRGYCDSGSLKYLSDESIPYVIMVKGCPAGHSSLLKKYGSRIRMKAKYLVRGAFLFGVQERAQLFKGYKHEDYVTLFYDYRNASDRATTLLGKLYKEIEDAERIIKEGFVPEFESAFAKVLKLTDDRKGVEIIESELQKMLDEKGMYSLVSSEEMTPAEVHRLYQARNCSETAYMILKTQLGYGKVRIRATKGVQSKFAAGFIASCLRYELMEVAKNLGRSANNVIQELNHLAMTRVGESFVPVQGLTGRQKDILRGLGASEDLLSQTASNENNRIAGRLPAPRHRKPGAKKREGKAQEPDRENPFRPDDVPPPKDPVGKGTETRKKPGVKTGTKRNSVNKDGSPRKKPGVPKGSRRGAFNKDGSPRKKPGPKPKETATTATKK